MDVCVMRIATEYLTSSYKFLASFGSILFWFEGLFSVPADDCVDDTGLVCGFQAWCSGVVSADTFPDIISCFHDFSFENPGCDEGIIAGRCGHPFVEIGSAYLQGLGEFVTVDGIDLGGAAVGGSVFIFLACAGFTAFDVDDSCQDAGIDFVCCGCGRHALVDGAFVGQGGVVRGGETRCGDARQHGGYHGTGYTALRMLCLVRDGHGNTGCSGLTY